MPRKLKKPLQTGTPAERQAQKTVRLEEREKEILHSVLPKTRKARQKLHEIGIEAGTKKMERRIKDTVRQFKRVDPENYELESRWPF